MLDRYWEDEDEIFQEGEVFVIAYNSKYMLYLIKVPEEDTQFFIDLIMERGPLFVFSNLFPLN